MQKCVSIKLVIGIPEMCFRSLLAQTLPFPLELCSLDTFIGGTESRLKTMGPPELVAVCVGNSAACTDMSQKMHTEINLYLCKIFTD